jgi:hypothetical protein
MMFTRQKLLRNVLAVGTVSAIVLFQSISTSNAADQANVENQPINEPALDHFKCYSVKRSPYKGPIVALENLFGEAKDVFGIEGLKPSWLRPKPWLRPNMLCNPVEKVHNNAVFPMLHPREHLVCYRIKPESLERTVVVANQFGNEQYLRVGKSRLLCVPSWKSIVQETQIDTERDDYPDTDYPKCQDGDQKCSPLDHFQCYSVRGKSARHEVYLKDQFGEGKVEARWPRMLCSPATKKHNDQIFWHYRPNKHLVCYWIERKQENKTVKIANQFEKEKLQVGNSRFLCLPSKIVKYSLENTPQSDDQFDDDQFDDDE